MLHCPKTDQCACSAKTSLAMNGNRTVVRLSKMIFHNAKEVLHNFVRRIRPIDKEEIIMRDSSIDKMLPFVLDIVESYNLVHSYVIEYVNVLPRMLSVPVLSIPIFDRSHERHELAWNNPVQISIFNTFVVFVFFDIKGPEIIPSEAHGVLKPLEAMQQGAVVEALTL